MANVIEQLNRPTLVIAHNKTLAAQLYSEFREMFPDNAVEYFVSYYGKGKMWTTYGVIECYFIQDLWMKDDKRYRKNYVD